MVIRARSWGAPASCDIGFAGAMKGFSQAVEWADVVQYHFPWPFADLLHLLSGRRKPAVMTYHSDVVGKGWLGRAYRPLMMKTLRSMRAVVATSPAYLESSVVLEDPVVRARTSVIPLGINEESYERARQEGDGIDVQATFGLPDNYVLFVGVLRPYKGLDFLIDAAKLANVNLVIAGGGKEKKRLLERSGEFRNIYFVGPVSEPEKMALIGGCQALILSSHLRSEAFGMVLVEASMQAKALVSCEISTGTTFVNLHGETGLTVPAGDPVALATAMTTLSNDSELAVRMGLNARRRYEHLFSGEAQGAAYCELYEHVVNS